MGFIARSEGKRHAWNRPGRGTAGVFFRCPQKVDQASLITGQRLGQIVADELSPEGLSPGACGRHGQADPDRASIDGAGPLLLGD